MTLSVNDRRGTIRFVLSGDYLGERSNPSVEDVLEQILCLDPSEGPGFACLTEDIDFGDYLQVAGGFDPEADRQRYCVERRVHTRGPDDDIVSPDDYEHLVAGYPCSDPPIVTEVKTHGFKVDCRTHEVLLIEDVIVIFLAFMEKRDLPTEFDWRSNRAEVDAIGGPRRN